MGETAAANVGAYALQAFVLLAVGLLLPALLKLRDPRVGLRYWQGLLAVILLLPLLQPWHAAKLPAPLPAAGVTWAEAAAPASAHPAHPVPWIHVALIAAAAIALARIIWLLVGLGRLKAIRRGATPILPLPPWLSEIQRRLGVRAEILLSPAVSAPLTFGWRRPTVLVPEAFQALPREIQSSVACHELLHVRRRDWVALLAEEAGRSLLWFHPAVWLLIKRISACREQVVDSEAVLETGDRRSYLEALRRMAVIQSEARQDPALLFLGRNPIVERANLLIREARMTRNRILAVVAALALTVALTAALGAFLFPLTGSPGSLVGLFAADKPQGKAFAVDVGASKVPGKEGRIQCLVQVKDAESGELLCAPRIETMVGANATSTCTTKGTIHQITVEVSADGASVTCHFSAKQGDKVVQEDTQTVKVGEAAPRKVYKMDENRGIKPPEVVSRVEPVYPEDALKDKVAGKCVLQIVIDENGDMGDATVLKSDDGRLDKAAIDAVRQWKFKPATLKGKPVAVAWVVYIKFTPVE